MTRSLGTGSCHGWWAACWGCQLPKLFPFFSSSILKISPHGHASSCGPKMAAITPDILSNSFPGWKAEGYNTKDLLLTHPFLNREEISFPEALSRLTFISQWPKLGYTAASRPVIGKCGSAQGLGHYPKTKLGSVRRENGEWFGKVMPDIAFKTQSRRNGIVLVSSTNGAQGQPLSASHSSEHPMPIYTWFVNPQNSTELDNPLAWSFVEEGGKVKPEASLRTCVRHMNNLLFLWASVTGM